MLLRINFSGRVVVVFVATAAVTGIIGNRADEWFVDSALEFLAKSISINVGWLIFILLWTLFCPIVVALRFRDSLNNVSNLVEVGDVLARNILSLYEPISGRQDAEGEAQRFAQGLFRRIVQDRPFNKCGIAIYYPDPESRYLRLWEHYGEPNESDRTLAFYIGSRSDADQIQQPVGIAGKTFTTRKTWVVHFDEKGVADDNDYFPCRNEPPRYCSLICTPILDGVALDNMEEKPIGVLCFYSTSVGIFDNSGVVTIVESLATRLSIVLQSFEN